MTWLGGGLERDRGGDNALPSRPLNSALFTELPVLPGLHVDAHYLTAGDAAHSTGRAWFDVIALADGRAAVLVGDAARHQVTAVAVAAQVRAVLAPVLAVDHDLVAALEQLNDAVDGDDAVHATTVCIAIVDPIDGAVQYSTCGHSAPLIVAARGRTRGLRPTGGSALGEAVGQQQPIAIQTVRMDRDEVLMLHSDGLASESRLAVAAGMDDFPDIGAGTDAPVPRQDEPPVRTEVACRTTAAEMRRAGNRDDLVVLAVQHRPRVPRLAMTVPALVSSMAPVGEAVGNWMAGLRSSVEDGAGMALAVEEAMTNSIQHAFVGARIGSVTIEATLLADGVLACSVRDDGRWLPPTTSTSGHPRRGLRLIARVADRMMVDRRPGGTVVELRRRLHHPVGRAVTAS